MIRCLLPMLGVLLALGGGCARKVLPVLPRPTTGPAGLVTDRARTQADLMNLADDLITAITDVYGEVEGRAADPQKRYFVQSQKADIAQAALSNAVNPLPLAGMMDMMVLVSLTRSVNEEDWARQMLGPQDSDAVLRVFRAQEETMWRTATRYVSEDQLAELRELIARWRQENPQQRYVAQVRMVDFAESMSRTGQGPRSPNSILSLLFLDPLAGIDPAVRAIEQSRDAAERMFFYAQRMPIVVSWQMELLYRRMLAEPQLNQVLSDVASFSNASQGFAKSSLQFADSVEAFRKQIPAEREQALDQIGRLVTAEREAAIRQATTQVSAASEQAINQVNLAVTGQRDAILTQATTRVAAEREAAIDQFIAGAKSDLLATLQESESAIERSIDRFYSRMKWLSGFTILSIFVMLVMYRYLTRARSRNGSLISVE